jgi:hypothetical protein
MISIYIHLLFYYAQINLNLRQMLNIHVLYVMIKLNNFYFNENYFTNSQLTDRKFTENYFTDSIISLTGLF